MDPGLYKDFKTSRDLTYHYYLSPAKDGKPTLLLLHGFPETSLIWRFQVDYFKNLGYGLIVPDLLGYGGTDKPTAPELYALSLIAKDVDEILAAERTDSVVAIGHDWGVVLLSSCAVHYPARIRAYGFLSLSFSSFMAESDIDKMLGWQLAIFGRHLTGYMKFLAEPDAGNVIMNHFDSFWSMMFPEDPTLWKDFVCPPEKLKEWVLSDRKTEINRAIDKETLEAIRNTILQGGVEGPLCWYKAFLHGHTSRYEQGVSPEKYIIEKPVFYGAGTHDYVCTAEAGKMSTKMFCRKATVVEYNGDHWFSMTEFNKLNRDLHDWLDKLDDIERASVSGVQMINSSF